MPAGALSANQLARIDSVCQAYIEKGNTVGLSLGIAHHGNILFAKGYGKANIVSGTPATDSTIYPIASVSKFVTAVATMKLVEQGKLQLHDKVIDFFEGFPEQEFMDEITVEHLLRHQSGLPDHEDWMDSIYMNEKRIYTLPEFFKFLDQPLFFRPGTYFSYSNSGYALLSVILETVEQKSYHDLIRANLGEPFGLASLGAWPVNWSDKNATMGYERVGSEVDTSFHMMTGGMKGDGGLSASVTDLLRLMAGINDGSILSDSTLDRMLSPSQFEELSVDYGLGVRSGKMGNQRVFGHSGGYHGTGWAMLAHYPDTGFTFAAAMNTNYSPQEIWSLRHHIMPIVLDLSPPELDSTATVANADGFTGTFAAMDRWTSGNASVRTVTADNGKLIWDNPETPAPGAQLFQLNDSTFTWAPYPYDLFIFHEVDGKVRAVSEYADGFFVDIRPKIEPAIN